MQWKKNLRDGLFYRHKNGSNMGPVIGKWFVVFSLPDYCMANWKKHLSVSSFSFSENGTGLAPVSPALCKTDQYHQWQPSAQLLHSLLITTVEPCCQGLGGVLLDTSSQLLHLRRPLGAWQCVGSPAAQWFWRPSTTTTTVALTDGRSALGRANGLFSWRRPTMTGGRWDKSSSLVFSC